MTSIKDRFKRWDCVRVLSGRPGRRLARQSRRGAMLVLVAVLVAAFLAMVAISIEIAHIQLARTELRTATDEHVGMASYEATATIDALLTSDLSQIDAATDRLRAAGFTSISRGMEAGQQIFQSGRSARFVERTLIVMTDGLHNRGPEPRIVAHALANEGVVIHTITFGSAADIPRMQEVATIGRGRHFHASDGTQLAQIYREIAFSLSTLLTE